MNWEAEHVGAGIAKVIAVSEITFKVKSLIGLYPTMDEYNYIEPIPLTPEWLGKCGFNRINHVEGYSFFAKKGCCIDIYENKTLLWGHVSYAIKYLHQLQNLYHALTGEELTITLR